MRIENPLRSRPLFAQEFTLRDVIELFFCLAASKYVTAPAPAVRGCLSQTICQYPSVGARQSLRTLRGVESVILLNIARFKQAVQSTPCLFGALCSALRRKTFFFVDSFELLPCLAASKYVTAHAPAVRGCLSQTICQYPLVGARQSLCTLRGVESVILLNIARFKQAVQSPPCLFGALCSALRRKTFFRRFFELLSCLAAACRRCLIPRERCPLCLIPRTGVTTFTRPVARTAINRE